MSAHSPNDGDPLIYILTSGEVNAAFYMPQEDVLKSVWDMPFATKWFESTYSRPRL